MSRQATYLERRPWLLWALSLVIAAIGAINVLLAWDHVARAGHYRDLGVSYPPLLRAGFALLWGVLFVVFGVGLARRRCWARRWILVLASNYGAFGVLWMIVFAASDFARGRIVFQAALTAGLIALLAWLLRWRRIRCRFPGAGDAHPR